MANKQIYSKVGMRIRNARKRKHLTQEQLAELVGVTFRHIGNIETGKKNIGNIELQIKIMNVLEMEPNEMFCDYVESAKDELKKEFSEILEGCSSEEIKVINNISKTVKEQLNEYVPNRESN